MPYIGGASPDSQVGTSAAYRSQSYTSTASQTTFTVDGGYTPGYIDVYVNGIKQVNGVDVTATNGTTVVFASALPAGYTVEVQALRNIAVNATSLPVSSIAFSDGTVLNSAWGSVSYLQYTGNGTQTAYSTTPYTASSVNYTSVYISGVYQRKNTYTWAGTTLTFTSAPPNGAAIEIVINFQTSQVGVPSYGTVTPNSLSVGGPYWDTSGNVGIGTTSPGAKLDVRTNTTADTNINVQNDYSGTAYAASMYLIAANTTGSYYNSIVSKNSAGSHNWRIDGAGSADSFRISTGASNIERMRIDSSGNIGVGTTNPGFKLEVVSSYNNGIQVKDTTSTVYGGMFVENGIMAHGVRSNHPIRFITNDTERMRIDSSGRVTLPYQPVSYSTGRNPNSALNTGGEGNWTLWVPGGTTLNRGSHFNTSTGRFTCPVAGVYFVHAFFLCRSNAAHNVKIYKNGSDTGFTGRDITTAGEQNTVVSAYIDCAANDILDIRVSNGSGGDFYQDYNGILFSLFG